MHLSKSKLEMILRAGIPCVRLVGAISAAHNILTLNGDSDAHLLFTCQYSISQQMTPCGFNPCFLELDIVLRSRFGTLYCEPMFAVCFEPRVASHVVMRSGCSITMIDATRP